MTIKIAERIVALLAAAVTVLAFMDTYLLNSRILTGLRIPPNVPTGLLIIVLVAVLGITFILLHRLSRHASESAVLRSERDHLKRECDRLKSELSTAQESTKSMSSRVDEWTGRASQVASLRKQVIAVLTPQSRDESGIRRALGIGEADSDTQVLLREVIGDLVAEGVIGRQSYSFDYEIRETIPRKT